MAKNEAVTVTYTAWDTVNNEPELGDVANHTLRLITDGVESVPAASPAEIGYGEYGIVIAANENTGTMMSVVGESSTPDVEIVKASWQNPDSEDGSAAGSPGTSAVSCELNLVRPEDSVHEGCPVLTKRRHVVIEKGRCALIEWPMRHRDGLTADLRDCFPAAAEESVSESESASQSTTVKVRFQSACPGGQVLTEVTADVYDRAAGLIRFQIPDVVCRKAGIYRFQAAVTQNGTPFFMDRGLISVEPGMWGDVSQRTGPLTLDEVRMHLRDTEIENDLLQDFEFDDSEIVFAITRPIMEWNETPPPVAYYSCDSFPFRYHWLNAVVAELLKTAAHHYVRNKMNTTAGGATIDDKAKDADYLRIANFYIEEWKQFIVQKKVQLNISRGAFSMGSDYGG